MSSPPIVQSAPRNHPRCASSPIGAVHHFHSHRDVQGHEPPWLRGRERPCKEKYACCTGIFQRGRRPSSYGGAVAVQENRCLECVHAKEQSACSRCVRTMCSKAKIWPRSARSCTSRLRIMLRDLLRPVCVVPISRFSVLETCFPPLVQVSSPLSERTSAAQLHDPHPVPLLKPSAAVATVAPDRATLL